MSDFSNWKTGKRSEADLVEFIRDSLEEERNTTIDRIWSLYLPVGEAWNQLKTTGAKSIAAKGGVQSYCTQVIGWHYTWVNDCFKAWKVREDFRKAYDWWNEEDNGGWNPTRLSGPKFVLEMVDWWRNKDLPPKPPKQRVQSDPVAKAQAEIVALTATVDILRRHKESAEAEVVKLQEALNETVPMDQWEILCAENLRLKEQLSSYIDEEYFLPETIADLWGIAGYDKNFPKWALAWIESSRTNLLLKYQNGDRWEPVGQVEIDSNGYRLVIDDQEIARFIDVKPLFSAIAGIIPELQDAIDAAKARQPTVDSSEAGQGSGDAPRPVWQHTLDKTVDAMVKDGTLSRDGDTIILNKPAQSVPKAPRKRNAKVKVPAGRPLEEID